MSRYRTFLNFWVWKMAWRDAKHNLPRLSLLVASLITGIAAMVAINLLNYGLQDDLDQNARELLGADLMVSHRHPFDEAILATFDSLQLEYVAGVETFSMAMFMGNRQSRLVRVVGVSGGYPFYGNIETHPVRAGKSMRKGNYTVVDEMLIGQYDIGLHDSVKIGERYLRVAGHVNKRPAAGEFTSMYVPSVYIALNDFDSTGLVQYGSRVLYKYFFKIETIKELERVLAQLEPTLIKNGYRYTTVEQQKKGIGKSIQSVNHFFALLAFVSLILGCIGVATSVHVYAKEKRNEVAILRCVGAGGWQAFAIFFIQVFLLGSLGSMIGVILGTGIQQGVLFFLNNYTTIGLKMDIVWQAIAEGLLLGILISALFAAMPLIAIRSVSPLAVLRINTQPIQSFSKARWFIMVLIILFPILGTWYQTKNIFYALYFSGGLAIVCGGLLLAAYGVLIVARKYVSHNISFLFRHALSNLFRPHNQTVILIMSIGLGVFVMAMIHIVQHSMLSQVAFTGNQNQSNAILFDIQPTQKKAVLAVLDEYAVPVHQIVPIVTCRLRQVNDRTTEQIRQDEPDKTPEWALTREYRITYRDSLHTSEKLLEGELQQVKKGRTDSIWVTLSESMAYTLSLGVGDSVIFDVQGVPLSAKIAGIRKVDWPKDPPNFIFVFPTNVLEKAPHIWVATMRINDQKAINLLQQRMVMQFPNTSFIDLRLVLDTINRLLYRLGLAIRFLALFSIATGMVVLAGAVMNSRYARIKENILLRAIGARARQLSKIALIEYAYLGFFSALTGITLACVLGWLVVHFLFEINFSFRPFDMGLIGVATIFLTLFIGWFNSRKEVDVPPASALRK